MLLSPGYFSPSLLPPIEGLFNLPPGTILPVLILLGFMIFLLIGKMVDALSKDLPVITVLLLILALFLVIGLVIGVNLDDVILTFKRIFNPLFHWM
jgi:hypothetical protein